MGLHRASHTDSKGAGGTPATSLARGPQRHLLYLLAQNTDSWFRRNFSPMTLYAPSPPPLAGGHVTRYPYLHLDSSASESQQLGQGPLLLRLRRLPRTSRPTPHPEFPPAVRPGTEGPSRPASLLVARYRSGRYRLSLPLALHQPPSLLRGSRWRPSTSAPPLLQDHQNLSPRPDEPPLD